MKKASNLPKNEKEILDESSYQVISGARELGEKASDIFSAFIDRVKEGAELAYDKGSEVYENVSLTAMNYIETYQDRAEVAKLKEKRDEVALQLGYMCFMEFSGRYRFRVQFIKSEEFRKLLDQIRKLDKQIIQIGEGLDAENQ